MKRLNLLLLISSAVTILGCSKELENNEAILEPSNTIDVIINADIQDSTSDKTRTVVDGTTIKWSSAGEKLKVYEVATEAGENTVSNLTSGEGVSTDSYATMSFPVSLSSKTADNFTYYASYPSSAWVSNSSKTAQANLETKKAQVPTATSFDPSADLLISKGIDNGTTQPTELGMQFARTIAIAKMTITNLPVAETVSKVVFTANNGSPVVLTGRTTFDLAAAEPVSSYGDIAANNEVEINTAGLGLTADVSMDIWFTCYPFELSEGDTFTVEVSTNTYTCTRTVTIPSARQLNFIAGKASRFSVDMTSAEKTNAQAWVKYTGDFSAGDYIIVYDGNAMQANVSSDRFTYSSVTPVENVIYTNNESIVWTAAASSTYWTFYNEGAAKYAASTGAKNKAQLLDDGSDDMSLWSVSGDGTYEFVNKKNTTNSVNANLRYNAGFGFACYSTGTGGALTLYKKDTRTALDAPATVSAALNGSDNTVIDVTFSSVTNAGTYTIVATPTVGDAVIKAGATSSPATISVADGLAYSTEYAISVYAVPADASAYCNSSSTAAAGTVTTGPRPAPTAGTMIWSEDFTGWSSMQNYASGVSHVYGGGTVDYSSSASCTYQNDNLAGGAKPEILITKDSNGKFIIKDIPISGATSVTLFYNTNHDYCTLEASVTATITAKSYVSSVKAWEITSIPADTETLDLTLTNTESSNCRADNFILIAGTKAFQTLSFAKPSISWTVDTDCTIGTPKAGQTVSGASSAVTYSSSDPTVATVNASTGVITPLKVGTTTITATAEEDGSNWEASKSYALTISTGGLSETLTFSDKYGSDTELNGVTVSGTQISATFATAGGSTAPKYYKSGTAVRWYGNNTMTISAGGKTITAITINYSQHNKDVTSDTNTYTDGSPGSWVGSATSVTFTVANGSGQNRITSVSVTYN